MQGAVTKRFHRVCPSVRRVNYLIAGVAGFQRSWPAGYKLYST